jgi:hypothetical protein
MISSAVESFLEEDSEMLDNFKLFEKNAYKNLHRIVVDDQGLPTLKKREFEMPGFSRQVMNEDDRVVFLQAAEKQMELNKSRSESLT